MPTSSKPRPLHSPIVTSATYIVSLICVCYIIMWRDLCVLFCLRSFENKRWYCFNDQTVSRVSGRTWSGCGLMLPPLSPPTSHPPLPPSLPPSPSLTPQLNEEDIEGAFGGSDSRSRGYYSSMYTSSANAYMLMYRRIDRDANKRKYGVTSMEEGLTITSSVQCSLD